MPSQSSALLIVLSAPSGAGKTTLCASLLARHPEMRRAITCTTRKPRPGEVDGRDYHFLERNDFETRLASGAFLENATVYGNRYGTLKSEVLEKLSQGIDVLLNIDVQGAESVRQSAKNDPILNQSLISVFLTPPDAGELERRLRGRGTEDANSMATRLEQARAEISQWHRFDYLLLSESPESDLQRFESILIAERLRQHRAQPPRFT